jgi:carbonic anhydrase
MVSCCAIEYIKLAIAFNYKPSPLNVVNNGHSIQVNYAPGSTVSIDGNEF